MAMASMIAIIPGSECGEEDCARAGPGRSMVLLRVD